MEAATGLRRPVVGAHNGLAAAHGATSAPCRTQRSAKARCLEEDHHRQVGEQLLVRGVFHRQHRASRLTRLRTELGCWQRRSAAAFALPPQVSRRPAGSRRLEPASASEAASRSRFRCAGALEQPAVLSGKHGRHLGPACPTKQQRAHPFAASRRIREHSTMAHRPNRCRDLGEPSCAVPPKPAISTSISPASRDSKSSATRRVKRR